MCGICGKIANDPIGELEFQHMAEVLAHRGPYGHGIHIGETFGFVHRGLAIIDLSTGQQPMCNEDESIWITFNREIYNYREFKGNLANNHTFKTDSDA